MPELLGRREIDLSRAGPKPNDLMAKHMHTRGLFMLYVILVTTGRGLMLHSRRGEEDESVSDLRPVSKNHELLVGRPHLVRSPRFIPESMFYTDRVNRQNDACSVGMRDDA